VCAPAAAAAANDLAIFSRTGQNFSRRRHRDNKGRVEVVSTAAIYIYANMDFALDTRVPRARGVPRAPGN